MGFTALYVATLFPGVGGTVNHGDSAKFQFLGRVLGLSHPPGNPLYLLLDAAWIRLPLPLRTATKVNLLSAVFAVGTLLFVYRTLARLLGPRAGVLAAVVLGTGTLFWTFATEAEVYTLGTFLVAGVVYYAALFAARGDERSFLGGSLFVALSFANHLTIVALVPALLWLVFERVRRGTNLRARSFAVACAFLLAGALLYGYIPWRVTAGHSYSEFEGKLNAESFWAYVTAKKFHGSFGHLTLLAAVRERMPYLLDLVQKQWMWPVLFAAPVGFVGLRRRARLFVRFLLLGVAGFFVFAFGYQIPDPEGFFMPLAVLLAFGVAVGWEPLVRRHPLLAWPALGVLLGAPAYVHLTAWSKRSANDVVEDMGTETKTIQWNLEDLFAHVPEGASFAVPCAHYGCVQVLNYYRFASPVVAERHISFVRLPNMNVGYWDTPPSVARGDFERARTETVCSIRKLDADAMRQRGILVDEIVRPSRDVREGTMQGVVLYCSHPSKKPSG